MISNSGAEVSSQALTELQSNLIALSNNLKELYDALHNNKSKLSEEWRDEKYDEFAEEFEQAEKVISELSDKYAEWANKYLSPRIDAVIEIEKSRGTLGSGFGVSTTSATNTSGSSAGTEVPPPDKAAEFRRGIDRIKAKMPPKPTPPNNGGFGQNERERIWWIMNQKTR